MRIAVPESTTKGRRGKPATTCSLISAVTLTPSYRQSIVDITQYPCGPSVNLFRLCSGETVSHNPPYHSARFRSRPDRCRTNQIVRNFHHSLPRFYRSSIPADTMPLVMHDGLYGPGNLLPGSPARKPRFKLPSLFKICR